MTDEVKQSINIYIDILRKLMKEEGLCFAFNIDKENFDNSSLVILNAKKYIDTGNLEGFQISLEELNKDLI